MRGTGGDFPDFRKSWGERPWISAAPIPGLDIGQNILFHEYELVRRATSHPAFKPIEMEGYLRELGRALVWVRDPEKDAELRGALRERGWKDADGPVPAVTGSPGSQVTDGIQWLSRAARDMRGVMLWGINRVRIKVRRAFMRGGAERQAVPETISGFDFPDDREALHSALAFPRKRSDRDSSEIALLGGINVTPPRLHDS
jgi:hypothetical protein